MTNLNKAISWKAQYYPFGGLAGEYVSTENNVRFPGQYHDRATDLYYNMYRTYQPELGRYLTPDPIGLAGGLNLYGYAGQDPINRTDPSGLEDRPWWDKGPFTSYGEEAVDYWATIYADPSSGFLATATAAVGGSCAALWTEENWKWTALTLGGAYVARVLGPFTTRGVPPFLQRLREYIRFDAPHHGKPYHWDGTIVKWLQNFWH